MSLASTFRPVGLSFNSPLQSNHLDRTGNEIPFQHEPSYLQLQRTLTRYQSLILLVPSPNAQSVTPAYDLTQLQRQVRAELYSSLPYHRTKWLHGVESARNLLLDLERRAQGIKSPRVKKEALRDLAEKRLIIKKLRGRIEEIGRGVESTGTKIRNDEDEELLGERADIVLASMGLDQNLSEGDDTINEDLREGQPVSNISEDLSHDHPDANTDRDTLFDSSVRRRQRRGKDATDGSFHTDQGTTSGFSNLAQTEKSLQGHTREHEDLTSALVSMAVQLKQQSRSFQFSLKQDEGILNRAVEGLDLNITSMAAASRNMAFLRRMSEEQGWLGRLKLYGIILALWVLAVLLVFVGPKLRF